MTIAHHLILDIETVPDPALAAPLQSERLRELMSQLPICGSTDCVKRAEWIKTFDYDEDKSFQKNAEYSCEAHKMTFTGDNFGGTPPARARKRRVAPLKNETMTRITEVRVELSSKAFGKPPEHQIVCIGYAWLENYRIPPGALCALSSPPDTESSLLHRLSTLLDQTDPVVVTFNGRSFDLPVLAARCLRHGVPFSWYWDEPKRWSHARYRYSEARHLDLMDLLSGHGASKASSQDLWARAAGLPGKGSGPTGADVAALYAAGEYDKIAAYCLSDVVQLVGLLLRVQFTRGILNLNQYREAAAALFEAAGADERVRWICAEMDLDRFLMRESLLAVQDEAKPAKKVRRTR